MAPRDSRRVLVLTILVVIACALGFAWLRRFVSRPEPEERAREKAIELQEKIRERTR